jgi:hypothetical protein
VLIRPDGFIAWRHASQANGARALDDALERLSITRAVGAPAVDELVDERLMK